MNYSDDVINHIICGDCLEVLKDIPDKSIDMVMTSPPYYALRNYQVEGQIGLEETFEEYLTKILEITAEIKRVLKKTGQFWLNLGDIYCSGAAGNKSISEANEGYDGVFVRKAKMGAGAKSFVNINQRRFDKKDYGGKEGMYSGRGRNLPIPEKCLLMMPERIAIALINQQGWILRNKIKWAKQILNYKEQRTQGGVMPTSVKDRFNESGEDLYFFVKNKRYYSNLDAVRLPNQVIGVTDMRASGFIRTRKLYPESKYNKFDYRAQNTKRKSLEERLENTKNKDQKSSRTYNIKKLLSEVRLEIKPNTGIMPNKVNDPRGNHEGGPGSWRDFKDKHPYRNKTSIDPNVRGLRQAPEPNEPNAFNIKGKNLPTIWLIQTEPHNFQKELGNEITEDHFATYPEALCNIPIRFGCPEKGIVLDPFAGSGTTCIVAKKLGRNYIGIELNPNYCKIAEKRLKATPTPLL